MLRRQGRIRSDSTDSSNHHSEAGGQWLDGWQTFPAVISEIRAETPGVSTYGITFTDSWAAEQYDAKPGQFNMLYLPGVGEAAISLSDTASRHGAMVHTIHAVGNVTRALQKAAPGYPLGVRGPFGSHWPIERARGRELIIVAGGIGLAPLRPVIYEVIEQREHFGRVSLLMGARSPNDLLYRDEYKAWQAAGIDVQLTVDRVMNVSQEQQWAGHVGAVTMLMGRLGINDPCRAVMFTCGPEVMMSYAVQAALDRGMLRENLWLSLERNMSCAIGHCGRCQLGPFFLCKDGPVLPSHRVSDLMGVGSL
jgi:NAD(P)H-flavin reductase